MKKIILIIIALLILLMLFFVVLGCASFGRTPRGERLERMRASPNYHDGRFWNKSPNVSRPPGKSGGGGLLKFIFGSKDGVRPKKKLPSIKTNLKQFERGENVLVWLGHSSLFMQLDGKRFLIDPVLVQGSPVWFANRAFKGTSVYTPEDIPEIDYLIITHDHWDHLDYWTLKKLKNRIGKIICGLGVGEDFEYWGFDKNIIFEFDWNETIQLESGFNIFCFPARHFSGRGLSNRNGTLWTSWVLQTPSRNIYISGDGGYDTHFAEIGRQFETIDLAIMENGQYNENWMFSHLMPEHLVQAIKDLHPNAVLTVHNSKFALSTHRWQEPLENIYNANEKESLRLITPMIGEPVHLDDTAQTFQKWWENIE